MEEILLVNPRRRKRRAKKARSHRRSRRRHGRSHRRLRNPRAFGRSLSIRGITGEVTPAIVGALGAMALDVGMAYLPLPSFLQSGWGRTLAQLGGALALGFVAARVPMVGRRNAQIATLGALTIVAYNAIRPLAAQSIGDKVKGLSGLADFGDYDGGGAMGAYMNPQLGAYMKPAAALLPGRSPIASMGMGAYLDNGF